MIALRFLRSARREIAEAHAWYEDQRPGLGGEFREELERQLDRISRKPLQFPSITKDMRKASMRKYPYMILFRYQIDSIEVIAVFHTSRDPADWQDR